MKWKQSFLSDLWAREPKAIPKATPPAKKEKTTASERVATEQAPTSQHPPAAYHVSQTNTLFAGPATEHSASDNNSLVATGQHPHSTSTIAFQPFADRDVYVCPYVVKGQCGSQEHSFGTYKKLCGHVSAVHKHDDLATAYEEDATEDGTLKVPCSRGCDAKFVTHQKANHHAKAKEECPQPRRDNVACSWPDCPFVSNGKDPEKGMANHVRAKHSKDDTTPYQCSKCAVYYQHDLYKLAMHEERCTIPSVATEQKTSMRFRLNQAALDDQPPTYIIIMRSSNRALEGWKADTEHYKTGLPVLGKKVLAHFAARTGNSTGAAVLHTAYECPTRRVPALTRDLSYLETDNHQKKMVSRGFKFPQAIVADIEAANQAGIKPFVISQGIDGWFCDTTTIHPWLQCTRLDFELLIKVYLLQYGFDRALTNDHGNVL